MNTPRKPPVTTGGVGRSPAATPQSPATARSPSRSSTPTTGAGSAATAAANGIAPRTRSIRSTPGGAPLSARSAVRKPGAPSNLGGGSTSASASPVDAGDEDDARAETAALIQELKERLQKAEAASEEYAKQVEVLQLRVDDALKEQAKLEERVHEEEERTEGLENEKREALRQHRELEGIYEAERAAMMKEKDDAVTREEELHEIIQRLKDGLSQRELRPGNEEEGRLSRNSSFRNNSRNNSQQNLENGHFAPPSNLQRSNSRGSSKLLLQKDKIIESLRLELAEAQIKLVEMENQGGGRMQELERVLLETRMTNARLLEENESFQLLLREKTLNGDFSSDFLRARSSSDARPSTGDARNGPSTSLADELDSAEDGDQVDDNTRRLEAEVRDAKEQNKALTLYINKIIERVLQHQGFESVLDKSDLDAAMKPATPDKDLPPPPPPKENAATAFLNRAKSVAIAAGRVRPRPMSYAAPLTQSPLQQAQASNSVTEDPNTAPSIPLTRSNSNRMSTSALHRRNTSDWPAAQVVSNMYRGPPPTAAPSTGQISPGIASPRSSFFSGFSAQAAQHNPAATVVAAPRVPSGAAGGFPDENSIPESPGREGATESGASASGSVGAPSPPRSVSGTGQSVMAGNKMRPLRLVQENPDVDDLARSRAGAGNRQSWIAGWWNKGEGGASG